MGRDKSLKLKTQNSKLKLKNKKLRQGRGGRFAPRLVCHPRECGDPGILIRF
jgi:hypothetical protein